MQQITQLTLGYNDGYRAVIMDIIEIFNYIDSDLKHHKVRYSNKTVQEILTVALNNREILRDDHNVDYFIRWNCVEKKFKFVKSK